MAQFSTIPRAAAAAAMGSNPLTGNQDGQQTRNRDDELCLLRGATILGALLRFRLTCRAEELSPILLSALREAEKVGVAI